MKYLASAGLAISLLLWSNPSFADHASGIQKDWGIPSKVAHSLSSIIHNCRLFPEDGGQSEYKGIPVIVIIVRSRKVSGRMGIAIHEVGTRYLIKVDITVPDCGRMYWERNLTEPESKGSKTSL